MWAEISLCMKWEGPNTEIYSNTMLKIFSICKKNTIQIFSFHLYFVLMQWIHKVLVPRPVVCCILSSQISCLLVPGAENKEIIVEHLKNTSTVAIIFNKVANTPMQKRIVFFILVFYACCSLSVNIYKAVEKIYANLILSNTWYKFCFSEISSY